MFEFGLILANTKNLKYTCNTSKNTRYVQKYVLFYSPGKMSTNINNFLKDINLK